MFDIRWKYDKYDETNQTFFCLQLWQSGCCHRDDCRVTHKIVAWLELPLEWEDGRTQQSFTTNKCRFWVQWTSFYGGSQVQQAADNSDAFQNVIYEFFGGGGPNGWCSCRKIDLPCFVFLFSVQANHSKRQDFHSLHWLTSIDSCGIFQWELVMVPFNQSCAILRRTL